MNNLGILCVDTQKKLVTFVSEENFYYCRLSEGEAAFNVCDGNTRII